MEIIIKWTVDSKSDEEAKKKVEALLKSTQGGIINPHDLYPDLEKPQMLNALKKKDDELQNLKLENDRLMQRDELMLTFISDLYGEITNKDSILHRSELIRIMTHLRKELEAL